MKLKVATFPAIVAVAMITPFFSRTNEVMFEKRLFVSVTARLVMVTGPALGLVNSGSAIVTPEAPLNSTRVVGGADGPWLPKTVTWVGVGVLVQVKVGVLVQVKVSVPV